MSLETARIALGGLVTNRLRSVLTMLSICIGVFAVIALMAVGAGAARMVQGELQSFGSATTITVYPQWQDTGSYDEYGNYSDVPPGGEQVDFDTWSADADGAAASPSGQTMLTEADLVALTDPERLPSVSTAVPVLSSYGDLTADGTVVFPDSMLGTTGGYDDIMGLEVGGGVFLNETDVSTRARVAVLGERLAAQLFPAGDALGSSFQSQGVSFDVVGVLEAQGGGGWGSGDNSVYVPVSTMQDSLPDNGTGGGYESFLVGARSTEQVEAAKAEVTRALGATHGLTATDMSDVMLQSNADQLESVRLITLVFQLLAAALASISLLVGGIGVMNIMLVTVTERTREIGIRKAIGARHSHLLGQFLLESVTLCLVGGVVGIVLGSMVQLIDVQGFSPVVTPFSVVLALSFSVGVGLFFGLYPAHKAASLRPVDALRYE